MTLLSSAQITAMRATADLALPDTVVISRRTVASDGAGGWSETWATAATVAGRLQPKYQISGSENVAAGQIQAVAQWVATLPAGTDLRAGDRVTVAGRTFEVQAVLSAGVAWRSSVRADLREVVA